MILTPSSLENPNKPINKPIYCRSARKRISPLAKIQKKKRARTNQANTGAIDGAKNSKKPREHQPDPTTTRTPHNQTKKAKNNTVRRRHGWQKASKGRVVVYRQRRWAWIGEGKEEGKKRVWCSSLALSAKTLPELKRRRSFIYIYNCASVSPQRRRRREQ